MTVHGSWTVDRLVDAYTHHQRRTRGLRPQTLRNRAWLARMLVRAALGTDPIDPSRLTPAAAVLAFFTSLRHRFSPASMRTVRSSLRSFFWLPHVLLCGRRPVHEMRRLAFCLTDAEHGPRHVPYC